MTAFVNSTVQSSSSKSSPQREQCQCSCVPSSVQVAALAGTKTVSCPSLSKNGFMYVSQVSSVKYCSQREQYQHSRLPRSEQVEDLAARCCKSCSQGSSSSVSGGLDQVLSCEMRAYTVMSLNSPERIYS